MSELLGHSEQLAGRVRQRLVMLPWTLVKRRSLRARSRALLAERLKADLDLTQAMRAHEAGSPHVGYPGLRRDTTTTRRARDW
jgi:hypothetical protein